MTAQILPSPEPSHPYANLQPMSPDQLVQLMQLLEEWLAEDSSYDESTFADLMQALN